MNKKELTKKVSFIIGVIFVLIVGFQLYKESLTRQTCQESKLVMDTVITLTATGKHSNEAVKESFTRLKEIEAMASATVEGSDVSKINQAAGEGYVEVHPEIMKMLEKSMEYSKLTNGAFDITVGPLITLWGIGTEQARVPSEEEIKEKLAFVGYENISLKENEKSVMLMKKGMSIELGGIAKGFGADEVRKIYEKYGIKDGLISMGTSTMYAIGKNDKDMPWAIGIANPRDTNSDHYFGVLKISNEALSTSGDYERFFIKDGKRYHHILDPKTGYPADSGVMSDTIVIDGSVQDSGMISDILSTALFILGQEEGIKLAQSIEGVSCCETTTDYKVYTSDGFENRLGNLNQDFTLE